MTPAAGMLGVSMRQLYKEIAEWLRSQGVEPVAPVFAHGGSWIARAKPVENSVTRTLLTLDKLRRLLSGELDTGPSERQHQGLHPYRSGLFCGAGRHEADGADDEAPGRAGSQAAQPKPPGRRQGMLDPVGSAGKDPRARSWGANSAKRSFA
jgi:hypothetical protein